MSWKVMRWWGWDVRAGAVSDDDKVSLMPLKVCWGGGRRSLKVQSSTNSAARLLLWSALRTCSRRRWWHPTPVLLPGKSHGWRSLVGCSPCGREESDTTEQLHFHFSLSCIGEGKGNPLQCSCLENPRDGGAWWASIYGVAQSQTRLKRLSSSSSKDM